MASNDAALAQLQKQAVARNGSAQQRPKLVFVCWTPDCKQNSTTGSNRAKLTNLPSVIEAECPVGRVPNLRLVRG